MGVQMQAAIHTFAWESGDVVITNDPYSTGGIVMHLNDIYLSARSSSPASCYASPGPSFIAQTSEDPRRAASTCRIAHYPFLAMALVNFVVTRSEAIHINTGIVRPVDIVLPEASVVNAAFPAACGMRFTTAMRVHDEIYRHLHMSGPGPYADDTVTAAVAAVGTALGHPTLGLREAAE
jgi:N-methylhydantoinase B/oxoprolinase/acetone carboxylase alpha subunit